MRTMITAAAVLMLLGGMALAQNAPRTGAASSGSATTSSAPSVSAPVGHRQPRASDVPSEKDSMKRDPEDAALDRKIKSICRGC